MKLEIIISAFESKKLGEEAPIIKVFRAIKDFKRRVNLLPSYKAIKDIFNDYEDQRQALIKRLIEEFAEDQNKLGNEVNAESIPEIPMIKRGKYAKELRDILNTDIEVKRLPRFTWDDIEVAKLDIIEMEAMDQFIQVDIKKEKPKAK